MAKTAKKKLFSDAEMEAMQETKLERKRRNNKEESLKACLAKIKEMKGAGSRSVYRQQPLEPELITYLFDESR